MATGYTPIYRIFKDGNDITSRFNDRTVSINVELQSGGGSQDICQILVDDRDWRLAVPNIKDAIEVHLGYEEIGLSYMGRFEIDEVTFLGPPRGILIHGNAQGMSKALKAPTIKSFDNKSIKEILQGFAEKDGLQVEIHPKFANVKIPFKNQVVSPMHLIHELERTYGAVAKVANGKLLFVPRDEGQSGSGIAVPILVLQPEHFGQWNVRMTTRGSYAKVKAAYWDKDTHTRKWVSTNRPGDNTDDDTEFPIGQMFNSKDEAQAASDSRMKSFMRGEVTAVFNLAKGDPWIRDQQRVLVANMRDGIDGSYVIDKAKHTYTKDTGIATELECNSPGTGDEFLEADDNFLLPLPGETAGEVLRSGQVITKDGLKIKLPEFGRLPGQV